MGKVDKIIQWGRDNPSVRVLILSGSLAAKGKKDKLSDYDIAVFGSHFEFIQNDNWLSNIGEFYICIHESFNSRGLVIPTRLTIFDPYFKVDFSFHPQHLLDELSRKLPWEYDMGYEVLLDKDGLTSRLSRPSFQGLPIQKPSISDFQNNMNEFWFEVYHVAKYLRRNDLWTAKFRDWSAKEILRQMIQWNHGCKTDWNFSPKDSGKGMPDWIDKKIWKKLFVSFGKFSKKDSMNALRKTIKIYRALAKETAAGLDYAYNQKADDMISSFVKK